MTTQTGIAADASDRASTSRVNQSGASDRASTSRVNQSGAPEQVSTGRVNQADAPDQVSTGRINQADARDRASTGRVNQKARTRAAIVAAVQDLARDGAEITMPAVARAALVSEATAYRYFPDLASLLRAADSGSWPDPAQALAPVADSDDPVERIACAAEVLLNGVLARQAMVRAMIAASVTRPDLAAQRPGHRFALIDYALAPLAGIDPDALAQLKQGLAVVVSAEALFVLTDLCGLAPRDAVASAVRTARALTAAAI